MENPVIDIIDRKVDFNEVKNQSIRAEHGIRSICVMYDEHSSDKNSKENIFILKENVHYRVFSLVHQYYIFLTQLDFHEENLQQIYQKNPHFVTAFPLGNPYFTDVDLEMSSVFDNVIFQISSVYDYLSHLICYICKTNKSDSLYWTKLAKAASGQNNDFSNLEIRKTISELNKDFVARLYDYRSRLLHNKKDEHVFNGNMKLHDFNFDLKILASDTAIRHFKGIRKIYPNEKITLSFLTSWIIRKTFIDIERVLDALREEIMSKSNFYNNLKIPKSETGLMFFHLDPLTNIGTPSSDGLWKKYKDWENRK